MDRPDLGVVGIGAGLAIEHDGIRVPTIEQLIDHIHVLVRHLVAELVLGGSSSRPKFWAAAFSPLVTMFQPKRPRAMWSTVAQSRASMNGG